MAKKQTTATSTNIKSTLEDYCAWALENLHKTLVERGASYGSFLDNSTLSVSLQELLKTSNPSNRMAMHDKAILQGDCYVPIELIYTLLNSQNLIAGKFSRLSATPLHEDSWLDIAGYAILAHAAILLCKEKK